MKKPAKRPTPAAANARTAPVDAAFDEVVSLIHAARQRAVQVVNTELIDLYWRIGAYLHHKIEADGWAKGTVVRLSTYIAQREPGIRGFSPQNLWRMRQFFEAYRHEPRLSALLRELPWSSNLHILTRREILSQKRADYGKQIVSALGRQLEREFGRGFAEKSLRHMIRFAEAFPDAQIVSALLRELSWTHFKTIMVRMFGLSTCAGVVSPDYSVFSAIAKSDMKFFELLFKNSGAGEGNRGTALRNCRRKGLTWQKCAPEHPCKSWNEVPGLHT